MSRQYGVTHSIHNLERRVAILEQRDRIARGVEDEYQRKQALVRAALDKEDAEWNQEKKRRLNKAQEEWLASSCWNRQITASPKTKARRNRLWDFIMDDIYKAEWLSERKSKSSQSCSNI